MFLKLVKGLTINVSVLFRGKKSQCASMDEAVIVLLLTFFLTKNFSLDFLFQRISDVFLQK